jgi:hypothetical protein
MILDAKQTVAFGKDKNFEVVNEFVYLGALVTPKNDVVFQIFFFYFSFISKCTDTCTDTNFYLKIFRYT